MMPAKSDPRNPFYILLIAVSLAFVLTALAYAVVPVLEQKARAMRADRRHRRRCATGFARMAGSGCYTKVRLFCSWAA